MNEEFFEGWDKKASERIADTTVIREVFRHPSVRFSSELMLNLAKEVKDATIEALKEMMVRPPIATVDEILGNGPVKVWVIVLRDDDVRPCP